MYYLKITTEAPRGAQTATSPNFGRPTGPKIQITKKKLFLFDKSRHKTQKFS